MIEWTEDELRGLKLSMANSKMMLAALLDRYPGLDIPKILELTDRQIRDFYLHPRDKKTGGLKAPTSAKVDEKPDAPQTYEEALATLDYLTATFHVPAEKKAQLKADVDRKYGK